MKTDGNFLVQKFSACGTYMYIHAWVAHRHKEERSWWMKNNFLNLTFQGMKWILQENICKQVTRAHVYTYVKLFTATSKCVPNKHRNLYESLNYSQMYHWLLVPHQSEVECIVLSNRNAFRRATGVLLLTASGLHSGLCPSDFATLIILQVHCPTTSNLQVE